jgi:BNR/Asp-box repeat
MKRRALYLVGGAVLSLVVASGVAAATAGIDVRVSTHDLITSDPYFSTVGGAPDVLQQNEPHIALHPTKSTLLAVGMNDVRTLGVSNDAWQGLAVSTDGGATYSESLIPGYPGDTSAAGLASPIRGNAAASDPWLGFDRFNNMFFAFIAFQRTPPGQPGNTTANALAVAKYAVNPTTDAVTYTKTVVVERGTVGLGQQEDKEALAVDNSLSSPFNGNVYICWARFTGSQNHLGVMYSRDHGETWDAARFVGPQRDVNNMQGCNLAVEPDGDVYVGYRTFDNNSSNANSNDSAIFVARSTDGGASFAAPARVATFVDYRQNASRTPPVFRTFSDVSMAADANGVYIAWQGRNGANGSDVFVSRSKLNGLPGSWETPVIPNATVPAHQLMPALAAAGGMLSVIWYDSRSEPAYTASGPVSGQCPAAATTQANCSGMDAFYDQASTTASGPLSFGTDLQITDHAFNPNTYGSIKAITPFIGDYIGLAATATTAYAVWTDNRDVNPTANAAEDADPNTNPPALINVRSRDANIYFDKIAK